MKLPEETPVEQPTKSYIQELSTHKVKVRYGTNTEELSESNFIVKLDNEPIEEIANGKFLVCELGCYDRNGNIITDDYPGMNPIVDTEHNIVTNYINTLGDKETATTNIYIKYTYFVDGVDVATAKVELVRQEGTTTYYMTPSTSVIKVNKNGDPIVSKVTINSYSMNASDNSIKDFIGYWKYK
jgi:hypothetical protein